MCTSKLFGVFDYWLVYEIIYCILNFDPKSFRLGRFSLSALNNASIYVVSTGVACYESFYILKDCSLMH